MIAVAERWLKRWRNRTVKQSGKGIPRPPWTLAREGQEDDAQSWETLVQSQPVWSTVIVAGIATYIVIIIRPSSVNFKYYNPISRFTRIILNHHNPRHQNRTLRYHCQDLVSSMKNSLKLRRWSWSMSPIFIMLSTTSWFPTPQMMIMVIGLSFKTIACVEWLLVILVSFAGSDDWYLWLFLCCRRWNNVKCLIIFVFWLLRRFRQR